MKSKLVEMSEKEGLCGHTCAWVMQSEQQRAQSSVLGLGEGPEASCCSNQKRHVRLDFSRGNGKAVAGTDKLAYGCYRDSISVYGALPVKKALSAAPQSLQSRPDKIAWAQ